ncbi:MAG: GDP-L-fucose synthase [Pseudomonadales bacterium]
MSQTIYVAGHQGMVGAALVRQLEKQDGVELVLRSHAELDLCDQAAVRAFFAAEQIDQIYLAASRVGGIHANITYPAELIYQNLMIAANIVDAAYRAGVQKLLFLGSSCIYPRLAEQPMEEQALLTGSLEPTNEPYGIAKIAGIKLCESYNQQYGTDYRSVMPANLYGSGDNFHPENSHVVAALMRRFHEATRACAPEVVVWGSGRPKREFLHVDDMAAASVFVMNLAVDAYNANTEPRRSHINVGTGTDCTIRELAEIMVEVVGFKGRVTFDAGKPDGAPRKLMSVERLKGLGWEAEISLRDGLAQTYAWFVEHQERYRGQAVYHPR